LIQYKKQFLFLPINVCFGIYNMNKLPMNTEINNDLEQKLQWLDDYNSGKREMPPFTREEMIEIREYQNRQNVELLKTFKIG